MGPVPGKKAFYAVAKNAHPSAGAPANADSPEVTPAAWKNTTRLAAAPHRDLSRAREDDETRGRGIGAARAPPTPRPHYKAALQGRTTTPRYEQPIEFPQFRHL